MQAETKNDLHKEDFEIKKNLFILVGDSHGLTNHVTPTDREEKQTSTLPTPSKNPFDKAEKQEEQTDKEYLELSQNVVRRYSLQILANDDRSTPQQDLSPEFLTAKASFFHEFPQYAKKAVGKFDKLRREEYKVLDQQHQAYLDCTGAMLPPRWLVTQHAKLLQNQILGNPHSNNPTSSQATKYDDEARADVLRYCNADPDKYIIIWTNNASGALKLVGESYNFRKGGAYVYAPDAHNSLIGIASSAKKKGAQTRMFHFKKGTLEWDREDIRALLTDRKWRQGWLTRKTQCFRTSKHPCLLGITGQSNVTGFKHDIKSVIAEAHDLDWDVMLDAAALAPSMSLDLSQYDPEFVCLSFYKIFGYPTGIGALVARKDALYKLQRNAFYGGTVRFVYTGRQSVAAVMHDGNASAKFEDGTINFQQTAAVSMGLKFMTNHIGKASLQLHVDALIGWLRNRFEELHWKNGQPVFVLPSRPSEDVNSGSSLAFAMLSPSKKLIPADLLEEYATKEGISIRTGCFCNPGSGLAYFSDILPVIDPAYVKYGLTNDPEAIIRKYKLLAMVRTSVGMATDFHDCYRFLKIIKDKFMNASIDVDDLIQSYCTKHNAPILSIL